MIARCGADGGVTADGRSAMKFGSARFRTAAATAASYMHQPHPYLGGKGAQALAFQVRIGKGDAARTARAAGSVGSGQARSKHFQDP